MAVTFAPELQRISEQARPYPAHLLPEGGTALCLFSAGFLGWNDAIHMARKRMTTTCVDIDTDKLNEMHAIYPPDWRFLTMDAWEFALDALEHDESWDAVSVDTFTGEDEDRALASLHLWCSLAGSIVTVTRSKPQRQTPVIPKGWQHQHYKRSFRIDWLVLTRA